MNSNTIIVYDLETGSKNPYKTQPIQIAAIAIDGRKLEVLENSTFESLIRPHEKAQASFLDEIEDEALKVNKKDRNEIAKAPTLDVVWSSFTAYCRRFNSTKNRWKAPIRAGFNNLGFDDIILNRVAGGNFVYDPKKQEKGVYGFGPWDDNWRSCDLFHPIHSIDLMKIAWYWLEGVDGIEKFSLDSLREYFGMSTEGTHDALVDVKDTAELIIRFLKLSRQMTQSGDVSFKDRCKERLIK